MNWQRIYKQNVQTNLNEGVKDFLVIVTRNLKSIFYAAGFMFIPTTIIFVIFFYYIFCRGMQTKGDYPNKAALMLLFLVFNSLVLFLTYVFFESEKIEISFKSP